MNDRTLFEYAQSIGWDGERLDATVAPWLASTGGKRLPDQGGTEIRLNDANVKALPVQASAASTVQAAGHPQERTGPGDQDAAGTEALAPSVEPLPTNGVATPVPLWLRAGGFALGVAFLMWVFGRAAKRGAPI